MRPHSDEGILPVCRTRLLCAMLLLGWSAWIGPVHAVADDQSDRMLLVEVVDASGRRLPGGMVAVCPVAADCREFPISPGGRAALDRELLTWSMDLTIVVYDADGATRFATSGWTMSSSDRGLLAIRPEEARGRLAGTASLGLELRFSGAPVAPLPGAAVRAAPSAWFLGAGAVLPVAGAYTDDDAALGGVHGVATGPLVMLGHRRGLPRRWPAGRSSLDYLDVTASYALNRYRVGQLESPGDSDLSFHRVSLGVGMGRVWRRGHVVVQGVVGHGGVYDGSTVLVRGGRTYRMLGFGVAARGSRRLASAGGRRLDLMAGASAIHYLADERTADHWFGTETAVFIGVIAE